MSPGDELPSACGSNKAEGFITGNGQTSQLALLRLMQIVSQGSPTGAFSYSQGLEWAVEAGWVYDIHTFESWVREQLQGTLAQQELPLMLRLYRAFEVCASETRAPEVAAPEANSREAIAPEADARKAAAGDSRVAEPGAAEPGLPDMRVSETYVADAASTKRVMQLEATVLSFRETSELRDEERKRGQAMARLVTQLNSEIKFAGGGGGNACNCQLSVFTEYCVAEGITVQHGMHGYAFAWLESQVMAGIKLVPLGQTSGQQVLYRLAEEIDQCVACAQSVLDDDVGYSSPALAMASSQHETQYSRLFRS